LLHSLFASKYYFSLVNFLSFTYSDTCLLCSSILPCRLLTHSSTLSSDLLIR
jgi:hypothetical protein